LRGVANGAYQRQFEHGAAVDDVQDQLSASGVKMQ